MNGEDGDSCGVSSITYMAVQTIRRPQLWHVRFWPNSGSLMSLS